MVVPCLCLTEIPQTEPAGLPWLWEEQDAPGGRTREGQTPPVPGLDWPIPPIMLIQSGIRKDHPLPPDRTDISSN